MQVMTQTSLCPKLSTRTTLYDLIEAISEELYPGEDKLVAEIVVHLFESGQVRFMHNIKNKS
jgi:hypothetical protein